MKTERVRKERFCQNSTISAVCYGDRLESQGTLATDKLFTGQRLDSTGLYYYGARYYDPEIGRFISADTIIPNPANPQSFNRYSYCLNNPLKYVDPSGHIVEIGDTDVSDLEDVIDEILLYTDGLDVPLDLIERLLALVGGWGEEEYNLLNEWEKLEREEEMYTQYMEESKITFDIVDVDASSKTVSFNVDLPLISFDEPIQLCFVNYWQMPAMPGVLFNIGGVSLYPDPIYLRTGFDYSHEYFTWLVAHESYHRWEQSLYVDTSVWYRRYFGEIVHQPFSHDKWPSEVRASKYASRYYQY